MSKIVDKISLSEFPNDTYIFLDEKRRIDLSKKLEKKFGFLRQAGKKIGITPATLYDWRLGIKIRKGKIIKRYISLMDLKRICNAISVDINSLQKHVIELKTGSRSGIIKNPKLPMSIVSETFAVLGHLLGDGYGGENGNCAYVNTCREALYNFIGKLTKAFGNVEYSINLKHKRIIISKIVPKILKNHFQIYDFRSSKSYINQKVFEAPRECLVELIRAIIVDEGRIFDSGIQVELSANPKLTEDLQKICERRLGYVCNSYDGGFIISCQSFPRVLKDMKHFKIPEKQKMFLKWFNRKSRKWYNRKRGITKEEIIKLLLKKEMSTKELASKIGIKNDSVRTQIMGYYLNGKRIPGLINLDFIEVKRKGQKNTRIFGIKDIDKIIEFVGV